jgi:MYXO-CTERM domain-containing protein
MLPRMFRQASVGVLARRSAFFIGVFGVVTGWAVEVAARDAGTTTRDAGRAALDGSSEDAAVDSGASPVDGGKVGVDASLPSPRYVVGSACKKDGDCSAGLHCVPSSSNELNGGAAANGLCTVDCTAHGQADCDAVDTGSLCLPVNATTKAAYCYERCNEGVPTTDTPKCHNRVDMACAPSSSGVGFCAPTCRADTDCSGRKCSLVSGLCVDSVKGTLPTGAACDPTAKTTACEGSCLPLTTDTASEKNSICSSVCSLGMPGSCGQAASSSAKPTAACLVTFDTGESVGDIGACAQFCDCNADCKNPNFVCQAVVPSIGRGNAGTCVPSTVAGVVNEGISCGDGGTDHDSGTSLHPERDAGSVSGKDDAGTATQHKASSDSSGCGCRVEGGGEERSPGAALFGVALLSLFARRRRARMNAASRL